MRKGKFTNASDICLVYFFHIYIYHGLEQLKVHLYILFICTSRNVGGNREIPLKNKE